MASHRDSSSAANTDRFVVKHVHLDLHGDPAKRRLEGRVTLRTLCVRPARELVLDVHPSLEVRAVCAVCEDPPGESDDVGRRVSGEELSFEVRPFTGFGSALHIALREPPNTGQVFNVRVEYATGDGPGVCWLEPEQTAGKVKPFFYTQGQAVLNRSFFPCADTPSVKITYSATIKVPHGLVAVMSASQWHEPSADGEFRFTMDKPIPSYLIALAIGDLESAEIGPRSRVWAEPSVLPAAKSEFNGIIEKFLSTGEELFGPYLWGRCDILIMPPSFPFGGMENPCLTFVTPCLLAGDRSLVDVLIHEISHSWFGNLVTNADWGEFWLNEGFTMYAQRRITTMIFGHAYMCLEAATGRALLRQHIDTTGEEHPLNKLRVKIEPGVDPDDTYNETPYEKGFCFVSYLAHLVGDQKRFDDFLKAYVEKFKFQSVVAEDMLNFYLGYFPELKQQDVANKPGLEFEHWLNVPGWPPFLPDLSPGDELMKPANDLANLWSLPKVDLEKVKQIDISLWKTYQIVYFLDRLLEKSPLPSGNVVLLEKTYPKVSKTKNAELRLRWTQIVVKNDHTASFAEVSHFLHAQGKQKYTLPIYRALWASSETARKLALSTFQDTKKQLHINVQNYVSKILV